MHFTEKRAQGNFVLPNFIFSLICNSFNQLSSQRQSLSVILITTESSYWWLCIRQKLVPLLTLYKVYSELDFKRISQSIFFQLYSISISTCVFCTSFALYMSSALAWSSFSNSHNLNNDTWWKSHCLIGHYHWNKVPCSQLRWPSQQHLLSTKVRLSFTLQECHCIESAF